MHFVEDKYEHNLFFEDKIYLHKKVFNFLTRIVDGGSVMEVLIVLCHLVINK